MEIKPSKGLEVRVNAQREAVFGEEGVSVTRVTIPNDKTRGGVLTGTTLAGYTEVEMPLLDGKKHWYPIDQLQGLNGEKVVEEEMQIDVEESDDTEGSEE